LGRSTKHGESLMRIVGQVLFLLSLIACGVSDNPTPAAGSALAICPTQLTAQTPLPAGARVLGKVEESLTLWDAEVSFGEPSYIGEDRILSSVEQDEDAPLPRNRYRYRYEIRPSRTDIPGEFERYMLACSYGANAILASERGPRSAMLLLPLPYKANARCDVVHDSSGGIKKRPLISARCELVK
jgi:hypothetical protein